jgi:predicted anti-sigma-YlaC factor YlaD
MTMNKECKKIREDLIDIFYNEKQMDREIEMHLDACPHCKSYLASLHELGSKFPKPEASEYADMQIIQQAFLIAQSRQNKRKERIDFIIFLLVVLSIMSIVVGIAAMGYGAVILTVQISFAALTSLLIPLFYIRKSAKEES